MTSLPRSFAAVLLFASMILPPPARAETRLVDWEELEPLIGGRTVSLVLPDGSVPRGRVLEVRPDALVLGISARAPLQIGRSSVQVVMLGQRGSKWRVFTTILGAAAGFVSGMFIADSAFDEQWSAGGAGVAGGMGIAGAVAGYYLGYELDSRSITYISIRH